MPWKLEHKLQMHYDAFKNPTLYNRIYDLFSGFKMDLKEREEIYNY